MKTINLRDFYSTLYNHDSFYDVPDEVAELLILYMQKERAQREYIRYHKAYYSLDRHPNVENEAVDHALSAEEVYERKVTRQKLYAALNELTDKQLSRLYAHFFLGMNYSQIARRESVYESSIRRSIDAAIKRIRNQILF